MKIIELCLSDGLGGLELYVEKAFIELSKEHEVTAVLRDSGRLHDRFKETGLNFLELTKSFHNFPLINAFKLAKIIDSFGADVIHVHWNKDILLVVLAKIFSKSKPKIAYHRHMGIVGPKKDLYHKFIFSQVDVMITITQNLANEAGKYLPSSFRKKISPLYYGVMAPTKNISQEEKNIIRAEYGFKKEDFVIGLFGRIEKAKGQYLLIDAISEIANSNIKALIVGHAMDEDYLTELKDEVASNCQDNIVFHGFVDNPSELMQCCDLIVLATSYETFGLVLAEAILNHVPIIGSNAGGVPEIIGEEESRGLLFQPENSSDLQEKILYAYGNRETMKDKAIAAYIYANKEFNYDKHFQKLQQLFANLIGV